MPDQRPLFRSFAAGEISPEAFGRIDLDKLQTGLALCRNFMTLPHGPAQNRPGTQYILQAKYPEGCTALLPFIYNTEQAYVLEVGHEYIRVHTEGGTVLRDPQSFLGMTSANPCVVTYDDADGDFAEDETVFIEDGTGDFFPLGGRYFVAKNVDPGADTFELHYLDGTPVDASGFAAYGGGMVGARVYEIVTPYAGADVHDIHYTQSADVMTLVHPSYQQRQLTRAGATNWSLTTLSFDPEQTAPTNALVTPTGSGSVRYRYLVTALKDPDLEESFGSIEATQAPKTVTGFTQANPGVGTTSAAHGLAVDEVVYHTAMSGMVELAAGYYRVNSVPAADKYSLKTLEGVVVDTTTYTAWTAGGTVAECGITNNLVTAGNSNKITWTNAAGATRYNVYKEINGLFGYIGQASDGSTGFTDDNITPDTGQTPPEPSDPFTTAGNYPGAVGYFEGRRWFGGTTNTPQGLWSTRSGTESNMARSIPTREDDGIAVRLRAQRADTIRHIVPLNELLLLTSGGEWRVAPQGADVITPMSISYRPAGAVGANNAQPVVTSSAVVYSQAMGGRVREMLYSWESQGYNTSDLCVLAPHLFDGHTIISMAYSRSPHPTVWCVRDDGVLLGMTYLPEHKVSAWHQHTTQGKFESVAVIPEGDEDRIYVVVNRCLGTYGCEAVDSILMQATTFQTGPGDPGVWDGNAVDTSANSLVLEDQVTPTFGAWVETYHTLIFNVSIPGGAPEAFTLTAALTPLGESASVAVALGATTAVVELALSLPAPENVLDFTLTINPVGSVTWRLDSVYGVCVPISPCEDSVYGESVPLPPT